MTNTCNRRYVLGYGLIFRKCRCSPRCPQWASCHIFIFISLSVEFCQEQIYVNYRKITSRNLIFGTNTIGSAKSLFRNRSIEKVRIIYTFHKFTFGCQYILPPQDLKKVGHIVWIWHVDWLVILWMYYFLRVHHFHFNVFVLRYINVCLNSTVYVPKDIIQRGRYIITLIVTLLNILHISWIIFMSKGCHGRDRMVVGLITNYAIGAYHH